MSAIDITKPTHVSPQTADVRSNFATAATEIDAATALANTAQSTANTKETTGVAAGLVTAHTALADPHTQYQLKVALGTASALNAPVTGNAAASEAVKGSDTRLTDARTPTAHTQTISTISDSSVIGRTIVTAVDAAAVRTAINAAAGSGSAIGTNTGDQTNIAGNAATVTTNANLSGDVTSVGNATTLTNAPVIAKVLTGYVSGAGTVAATDSILAAIQKINGNDALKAPLASPTFTGTVALPAGQAVNGVTLTAAGLATNFLTAAGTYAAAAGGGGAPGGATTQLQYNNAGAFAGSANAVIDGAGNVTFVQPLSVHGFYVGQRAGAGLVIGVNAAAGFNTYGSVFLGTYSGYAITSGLENTATGHSAGFGLTSGGGNTLYGNSVGISIGAGNNNTVVGKTVDVTGNNNTYIGQNITPTTGLNNTIIIADGAGNRGMVVDSTGLTTFGLGAVKANGYVMGTAGVITDATAARTLSAGDNGKVLYFTSAAAVTLTMATGLGAAFSCSVLQGAAGQINFAAGGQTMTIAGGLTKTASTGAMASIMAPVANTFFIAGTLV